MRLLISNILLIILLYSCTSASDYLQEAVISVDKGNYREAIPILNKALEKNRHLKEAYTEKAYCYSELKRDDSALIVYQQLIDFDPNNTLALYNSGLCNFRNGKFNEAVQYFNRALTTKGYNPEDSAGSGFTIEYTEFGKQLLGEENKFDVSFAELFYMAGQSHFELGQMKKAYSYFKKCISRSFNVAESYYMIGLCWLSTGEKDKACESFQNSSFYGDSSAKDQIAKICQ